MPANSFKFVSPGIFLNEIDNSQVPQLPGAVGPTVIGRASKGRALAPVKVDSFSDFVDLYGSPVAGGVNSEYRTSDFAGPTYGVYGAQAYLNANVGPVNYVRLLGVPHPDATDAGGYAGWTTNKYSSGTPTAKTYSTNGGAIGMFVAASQSNGQHLTGTLAAVFYLTKGSIFLSGTIDSTSDTDTATNQVTKFAGTTAATDFTVQVYNGDTSSLTSPVKLKFNFDRDSSQFIRNVMNTNPVLTNDGVIPTNTLTKNEDVYWLGESYETQVATQLSGHRRISSSQLRIFKFLQTLMLKNTVSSALLSVAFVIMTPLLSS